MAYRAIDPWRRGLPRAFALVLACWALACGGDPRKVEFRFAPPEGLEVVQSSETTRTVRAGSAPSRTTRISQRTRMTVSRPDAWKYAFSFEPLEATVYEGGKKLDPTHPLSRAFGATPWAIETWEDGEFVALEGAAEILRLILSAADDQTAGAAGGVVTRNDLELEARSSWQMTVESLAGRTARIGDVIEAEMEEPITGSRTVPMPIALELVEWRPCGETRCVLVRVSYSGTPAGYAEALERAAERAAESMVAGGLDLELRDLTTEGHGELLVDPATMLVHSQSLEETLSAELRVASEPDLPAQHFVRHAKSRSWTEGEGSPEV